MPMKLISRSTFPPGGWWLYIPQTNWPPKNSAQQFFAGKTGDQVVDLLVEHALGNPRHDLPKTREAAWDYLELFTCTRLRGDPNYCTGAGLGKSERPLRPVPAGGAKSTLAAAVEKAVKLTKGIGVLAGWLGSGLKAVPHELACRRAEVCAGCPKNEPGGWESFFTGNAAELIRQEAELKNEMSLSTPFDTRLSVCSACLCVCSLKVHVPLAHIVRKLKPAMREALDPRCWILSEEKMLQPAPPEAPK